MTHIPLIIKHWSPLFDAQRKIMEKEPIWVRLPGLPVIYWKLTRFEAIGNRLGEYIDADYSFEESLCMSVA